MSSTDAPSFGLSGSAGIDHIVLIKAKPGTTEAEENALFEGVKSLSSIPGVLSVTVGRVFVEEWMEDRSDGVSYALSVRLESKEALRAYQDHPDHVEVKKRCVAPIVTEPPQAVDFESPLVLGERTS